MSWPRVRLGELLLPVSRPVPVEPGKTYRLLGAQWYAKGLFLRETKDGSEIRARTLFEVREGDFVYNRLFAWKGSFAIAREPDEGGFVSNEFPCFAVRSEVALPRWIQLYFSQETVWREALGLSSGGTPTSRNRLKEERLLEMEIPLPPLPEQRRIVAWIESIAERLSEVQATRRQATEEFRQLLGSAFARIVATSRRMRMAEVAPLTRRPVEVQSDAEYPELGIRSFGRGTFHKPSVPGFSLGIKRLYRIEPGDLLFNNVFAWEGAVAVVREADAGRFGSHRFMTCVPERGLASAGFLKFYFLSAEGLESLGSASPGGAGRNRTLGVEALAEIAVPVPEAERLEWFDRLLAMRDQIEVLDREMEPFLGALIPAVISQTVSGAKQ